MSKTNAVISCCTELLLSYRWCLGGVGGCRLWPGSGEEGCVYYKHCYLTGNDSSNIQGKQPSRTVTKPYLIAPTMCCQRTHGKFPLSGIT